MEEKVKSIIEQILIDNGEEDCLKNYSLDANLKDDLGLDSFSLALLTVQIEDEFDIDVFDNGYIPKTVGDIISQL
jgi:acyl carrier protein